MRIQLFGKAGKHCNTTTNVAGGMALASFKASIADSFIVAIH
jgi:hypothetical protein